MADTGTFPFRVIAMRRNTPRNLLVVVLAALHCAALAQLQVPSDGSDGIIDVSVDTTIDLGLAPTGVWNQPGTGVGVYDPERWAVVFKLQSLRVRDGARLTFRNHPKNPPVVFLVQGDVTVDPNGSILLNGGNGNQARPAEPGPGGFRGGGPGSAGLETGAGFGPGGGAVRGIDGASFAWGTHATQGPNNGLPIYSNSEILPLIGGSGAGAGATTQSGGGAGGGAVLIATGGTLTVNGIIDARGGSGNFGSSDGAGGAVRLVASRIAGSGQVVTSNGGSQGQGRTRFESGQDLFNGSVHGTFRRDSVGTQFQLWPVSSAPSVRIARIGSTNIPADPKSEFSFPTDATVSTTAPVRIRVEATNVPTDGSWSVFLRTSPRNGEQVYVQMTLVSGSLVQSFWEVDVAFPRGFTAMTARAARN